MLDYILNILPPTQSIFTVITDWIEAHEHTVGLLEKALLLIFVWASGFISFLLRYKRKAILEITETASLCFVEYPVEAINQKVASRAAFVINASLVNASNEKVVLDYFELSFQTEGYWHSFKQRLVRLAFPSRPRKRLGEGTKHMGVWFTEYPTDEIKTPVINGSLEPKALCGGYLLFVSFSYGNWNPKISNGTVKVRLKAKLSSQQWLKKSAVLRIETNPAALEELSPGFIEHINHESTWNHDLSLSKKSKKK